MKQQGRDGCSSGGVDAHQCPVECESPVAGQAGRSSFVGSSGGLDACSSATGRNRMHGLKALRAIEEIIPERLD